MTVVTVSAKGQLVIPKGLREALGIDKGTQCSVDVAGGAVLIHPLRRSKKRGWRRWEGRLRGTGALEAHLEEHRKEVAADEGRA